MTSYLFHLRKVLNPMLLERFNLNYMEQLPSLKAVLVSSCNNLIINQQSALFHLLMVLELLTEQHSVMIKAKESVASFKLKKGTVIGGKVTLLDMRGMNFVNKLNILGLARISQFKGFSMDSKNAINLGIQDLNTFIEIENKADKLKTNLGLTLTVLINSNSMEQSKLLLAGLQIPVNYKI